MDFLLDSLRGGLNIADPAASLAKDACTVANNVEFFLSTLGERRKGCEAISLPTALVNDLSIEAVSFAFRHLPTNDEGDAELWVLGQSMDGGVHRLFHNVLGVWSEVAWTTSGATTDSPIASGLIEMRGQSFHGKLYLAFKSAVDRLHVWDGTRLRRVGLREPVAPGVAQAPASATDYANAVIANSPTGYWRLEEASGNFADSSGNGKTFTVVLGVDNFNYGAAGAIAGGGFGINYALPQTYDPADTISVTRAAVTMWKPSTSTPGSIEFWVRPSADTVNGTATLTRKVVVSMSGASGAGVGLALVGGVGGVLRAEYRTQAGTSFYNSTPLVQDTLYHIALVISASGGGTWYLNGVADGVFTSGADEMNAAQLFNTFDSLSACLVSLVDEIAVYSTALSAANVLNHYNLGARTALGSHYYRTRFTTQVAGVTTHRSEPSDATLLPVVASNQQITVSRPALIDENESHWEVEASLDDATYYVIATLPIATTTWADTVNEGLYATYPLSDPIGTYGLVPSGRLLSVDKDRLVIGASHETVSEDSFLRWTPVGNDPLPGADERLNKTTDPEINLDGREGGGLTSLSRVLNGYFYAFKGSHIYKVMSTGELVGAYDALCITKTRGALPFSLIEASDQAGRPSIYFWDQLVGPMRIGMDAGLQACGADLRPLVARVNIDADRVCHGVYYASKIQVHWWIAVDGATTPNWKAVLQTNEIRSTPELGARRGWSVVPAPARIASALCSCMFANNNETTNPRSRQLVPFIGKQQWDVT